jgi:hypothetical protein
MTINDNVLNSDFDSKLPEILEYFNEIYTITGRFNPGCGSYLFDGQTYTYTDRWKQKQILIYELAETSKNVFEIGVYMGHSLAIMLAANNELKATVVDTDGSLPAQAVELLKSKYPKSQITFINSDSNVAMDNFTNEKFDLFHIDGDHNTAKVQQELDACKKFNDGDIMRILFDDIEISSDSFASLFGDLTVLDKYLCTGFSPAGFYKVKL